MVCVALCCVSVGCYPLRDTDRGLKDNRYTGSCQIYSGCIVTHHTGNDSHAVPLAIEL